MSLVERGFVEFEEGSYSATVRAKVRVAKEYYFGPWPVETRGFKDERSGALITRELTTHTLEPSRIEQGQVEGWRKVDDPSALATRPTIRLEYSDVIELPDTRPGDGAAAT